MGMAASTASLKESFTGVGSPQENLFVLPLRASHNTLLKKRYRMGTVFWRCELWRHRVVGITTNLTARGTSR
jgi:hypothetical protein